MTSKIYYPPKWRRILLFFLSLSIVVSGIWIQRRDGSYGLWISIFFFAICSAVMLVSLHPKASLLKIDESGFTIVSFFKSSTFKWAEVDGFRVEKWGHKDTAFFNRFDPTASDSVLAWRTTMLPMDAGFSPSELVCLLNKAKEESKTTAPLDCSVVP